MVTLTGERISVGAKLSYSWLHMLTVLTSDSVHSHQSYGQDVCFPAGFTNNNNGFRPV